MSLVHHWPMDDNAASTVVAADAGTDAILQGGDNTADITTTGPGGTITAALDLDGSADHIAHTSAYNDVSTAADFSISEWIKFDTFAASGENYTLNSRTTSSNDRISIGYDGDVDRFGVDLRDGSARRKGIELASSTLGTTWHHVVVTYDQSANLVRLYIDNVEITTTSAISIGAFSNNIFQIGVAGAGDRFDGAVAAVRIYDHVLSTSEISDLYDESLAQSITLDAATFTMTPQSFTSGRRFAIDPASFIVTPQGFSTARAIPPSFTSPNFARADAPANYAKAPAPANYAKA